MGSEKGWTRNIKNLSEDEITRFILKMLIQHSEGVNIGYLVDIYYRSDSKRYNREHRQKLYQRFYRRLRNLEELGIVYKVDEKISKFSIYKLNVSRLLNVINLTTILRTSQTPKEEGADKKISWKEKMEYIKRANVDDPRSDPKWALRTRAKQILIANKLLDEEQKKDIIDLFLDYIDEVNSRYILLLPKQEFQHLGLQPLLKRYETRFNSERRIKRLRRQYREFWRKTTQFRWGVVITLTVDPSKVENLYEARYKAQEEFNRFMTWLRKFLKERSKRYGKTGRKYPYVRFIEYQQRGLIHYHVIVFGTRWVKHESKLAQENWRLGFVDVQTIINVRGKWRFKKKPKDYDERYRRYRKRKTGRETDGGSPLYASPFVYFYFSIPIGGFYEDDYDLFQSAMHWALETRFFTYSTDYFKFEMEEMDLGMYFFAGSYHELEIPTLIEYYGLLEIEGGRG